MTDNGMHRSLSSVAGLTAAGIDHVRLAYCYLAAPDLDGYLSLLDAEMTVHRPDGPAARGRTEVEALRRQQLQGRSMKFTVSEVSGTGPTVVAVGHYTGDGLHGHYADAEFCDLFKLAPSGLLLSQKTFFCVTPSA
ncbi:nuclear transport factor 2 family protein [Streptomyces sp. NPDC020681]|uniref:nuclear transport factor 2 family protein n=1 Tax=Streptomyces sp. NPDC020681 TaxID=3365083 RepID=UPI0037B51630